ncbi:GLPGLI family protein [Bergeyella sp. RCAD1439]|uniref:GLPGLI family protein n=1 Tax=Bergeyella anatis TaxID=3113737 RepID=UPI002E180E4E|nr:GLPGLI family protein [Bergeyella sp. RCAD1439]
MIKTLPLLAFGLVYSQSMEVVYERAVKFDEAKIAQLPPEIQARIKANSQKNGYVLKIAGGQSSFQPLDNLTDPVTKSNVTEGGNKISTTTMKTQKYDVYKNLEDKTVLVDTELGFKPYAIVDKLPDLKWEITDEKKELDGYPIQKAVGNYNGREVVAWFTDKIGVPEGPDVYQGLPGLIMRLESGSVVYTVSKVKSDENLKIVRPTKIGEQITFNKYWELRKERESNFKNSVETNGNTTTTRRVIRLN